MGNLTRESLPGLARNFCRVTAKVSKHPLQNVVSGIISKFWYRWPLFGATGSYHMYADYVTLL